MKTSVQIIQTHDLQRIPSVLITAGTRKYYFNIPENLTRFSTEHYAKPPRDAVFFFTQLFTDHMSGLLPLVTAIFEEESTYSIKIHGPPNLCQNLSTMRFAFGRGLLACCGYSFFSKDVHYGVKTADLIKKIVTKGIDGKPILNLNEYLENLKKESPKEVNDPLEFITTDDTFDDKTLQIIPILTTAKDKKDVLSYVCKTNKFSGKVLKEKLDEAKIPKNMIRNLLASDELEINGIKYRSSDFKDPDIPPQIILIIDCPENEYIDSLITNKHILEILDGKQDGNVSLIIHLSPKEIVLSKEYMKTFSSICPDGCHLLCDPTVTSLKYSMKYTQNSEESKEEDKKKPEKVHLYRYINMTNYFNLYFNPIFPELKDLNAIENIKMGFNLGDYKNVEIAQKTTEFSVYPLKKREFVPMKISYEKGLKLLNFKNYQSAENICILRINMLYAVCSNFSNIF